MKIIVLVKTIDFIYAQTGADLGSNYVGPDDTLSILNPPDEAALEMALAIKDQAPQTEVAALSLGGESAAIGLRRSLAMGADRAIRISAGPDRTRDSWRTAAVLAAACRDIGYDLILGGTDAWDDNAGLVGPYLAESLDLPHLSQVTRVTPHGSEATLNVQRTIERGDRQILTCRLPALLSVKKGSTVPRYPTLAGALRAERQPVENLDPAAIGASDAAPRTEVLELVRPKPKRRYDDGEKKPLSTRERIDAVINRSAATQKGAGNMVDGAGDEMFDQLDRIFKEAGILS